MYSVQTIPQNQFCTFGKKDFGIRTIGRLHE